MRVPQLKAPVVLVHGFLGFHRIKVAGWTLANYFPGIREGIEQAGNRVLIPWLSPTSGVAHRARQLKNFLDQHAAGEPVHILAHSMGGLDARHMISCLDMADRVLTLTTLGTPHRGTAFADWGIRRLERLLKPVLDFLGVPTQAVYDLTTVSCREFNERVKDAAGVRYFSVAGRFDGSPLAPEWLLPYSIVFKEEGPNDGVVSLASARYGESFDEWDGDHFSLVNWLGTVGRHRSLWRDPMPRYAAILRRLADCGF